MVIAVTTRDSRSVAYLCSSSAEDTMPAAQARAGVVHTLDTTHLLVCLTPRERNKK